MRIDLIRVYKILDSHKCSKDDKDYLDKCSNAFGIIKIEGCEFGFLGAVTLLREYSEIIQTITNKIFESEIKGE